ncbi:hypothetical protein MP228_005067 [Amoeboaphelidium protococcarum]|nr:hypothetical protein MP228_005067 [Amoeboaphelidium protococcarum]
MLQTFDKSAEGGRDERALVPSTYKTAFPIDVIERDNDYVVQSELAGIPKEAIQIELANNKLRIFGENTQSKDEQQGKWHVQERSYGKFERTLMVPKNADVDNISANYENGVLEVKIPKRAEALPSKKTIAIN